MKTVQEFLNKIRWDENLAENDYKIAYYDRVEDKLIIVAFQDIYFPADDHFAFVIADSEGECHSIPYHRVKEIYENDVLIWHRQH